MNGKAVNNITVPAWAHNLLALLGAAIVFYSTDKEFMALFPAWVTTVAHPTVALLTYLGISQVTSVPKP